MIDGIAFGVKYIGGKIFGSKSPADYYQSIGDDVIPFRNKEFTDGDKPMWLNLGYWKNAVKYDKACEDLALLLSNFINLNENDHLLDVGFGLGAQDLLWMKHHSPISITGINITPLHVKMARLYADTTEYKKRITFMEGSATEIPFGEEKFNKITALECAFHFNTREDFFQEAYRVLKPGGLLGLADMAPLKNEKFNNIWQKRGRRYLCFPDNNMYDKEQYRAKLEKAGFIDIKIESIANYVYGGARKYFMRRIFNKSLNPNSIDIKVTDKDLKNGPKLWGFDFGTSDYLLVSAKKPAN